MPPIDASSPGPSPGPSSSDRSARRSLAELVGTGGVLVLTGAGISTDSGIPDYRGPDGVLRHTLPMTYEQFTSSPEQRQRYWARSHLGWHRVRQAAPNAGHHAVASLDAVGLLTGTVTQNVDGLHTAAGSRDVIDLHGRLDAVVCIDCGDRRPRVEVGLRLDAVNPTFVAEVAENRAAATSRPDGDVVLDGAVVAGFRTVDCRACGGRLKPDVVFFGEHVPSERFRDALARLDRSRSLLVLGSSLVVGSGFRFVTAAARRGLRIAIVNRGPTRGDRHADVRVDGSIAEVLGPLASDLAQAAR